MRVVRFMILMSQPYRIYLLGSIIAVTMVTLANTVRPYVVKEFVDIVAGVNNHELSIAIAFYALLQCMLVGGWLLSDYSTTSFISKFRLKIAEHFMDRLYHYPYSFFQNQLAGSLTSKINDVFQNLSCLIFMLIHPFGSFILLLGLSIYLVASVAPIFAVSLVVWILFFWLITFFSLKKAINYQKEYAEEKSKIIGLIADYISNIMNTKLFSAKKFELARFRSVKIEFISFAEKQGFYFMRFYLMQGIFTTIYAVVFIFFLTQGYQSKQVSPGNVALVIMINFNIIGLVYEMSHQLREFVTNWGAVDQALKLLEDEDVSYLNRPNSTTLNVTSGKISFREVKFNYKSTEALFNDKSVEILPKQKVGLVGYSGGGKSTFVNLILRLHEVSEGAILIDDQDIRDVTQDSLRQSIAMIPQDPSLFHRSLMENIRYGRVDSTDAEVIEAAKKAHAHEFITKLPQGYESLVGERGVKLSGGQRQRIAIARAILKNAPILILDEATSQLDSVTENLIQDSLLELMKNKTTIIIAHRLSTLLHMDRILVFDRGRIVEDGNHDQLLAKNGLYKQLWDAQVGGFLGDERIKVLEQ